MRAPPSRRTPAGAGRPVVELHARAQPREVGVGRLCPASRPRRPCRPRSSDARAGARDRRRSSRATRRSCPRRGGRPERPASGWSTRSTTVRRPCGSLAVVTVAGRLVQEHVGERLLRERPAVERAPRPSAARPCSARPAAPFTVTRPALISSSALRRDATPARASQAFRRISATRRSGRPSRRSRSSCPVLPTAATGPIALPLARS